MGCVHTAHVCLHMVGLRSYWVAKFQQRGVSGVFGLQSERFLFAHLNPSYISKLIPRRYRNISSQSVDPSVLDLHHACHLHSHGD